MNPMFGQDNQTYQLVVNLVEAWNPSEDYGHESGFQNELEEFLDKQLNDEQSSSGMGGLMGGGGRNYVVNREHGKPRGDVVVDDVVGIEMKRHFSNSRQNTLRGQLEKYAENYPYVIALTCGIDDTDGWRELENKFTGRGLGMGMNQTEFTFIIKRRENFGESHNFGSGGGGLSDIPGL